VDCVGLFVWAISVHFKSYLVDSTRGDEVLSLRTSGGNAGTVSVGAFVAEGDRGLQRIRHP